MPAVLGTNDLTLEAYDFQGKLIEAVTTRVTASAVSPLLGALRITEVNFNPADAQPGEMLTDNDEFEFVEVRNVGSAPIDLTDVRLVQVQREGELEGVRFTFDAKTLAPGASLVVVRNAAAFETRYGTNVPIAKGVGDAARLDAFSGQLSNGGETLTLLDMHGSVIQQFGFDDGWYAATDGDGATLEFIDPTQVNLDAWNQASSWRASGVPNGTPGGNSVVSGESNRDGGFNTADLILALQSGEYEDSVANNSTFEEGDWNADGEFNSRDFVYAFTFGLYVNSGPLAARPVAPQSRLIAAAIDAVWSADDDDSPFETL